MRWTMALLAGLGCCALGYAVSSAAARRLRTLRAGEQALRFLRTGVCIRGELLTQVLKDLPVGTTREAQAWAAFFRCIGERLEADPGASLREVWGNAWTSAERMYPVLLAITEEDARLLEPLREELGRTPRAEQEKLLDRVSAEMQIQYQGLQKRLADTQRVSQTLGMLGGLAMFLLLI